MTGVPLVGVAGGWVRRRAWQRGMLGGSRLWLGVWCVVGAVRLLKWLGRRVAPDQAHTAKLRRGETIEIRHLPRRR